MCIIMMSLWPYIESKAALTLHHMPANERISKSMHNYVATCKTLGPYPELCCWWEAAAGTELAPAVLLDCVEDSNRLPCQTPGCCCFSALLAAAAAVVLAPAAGAKLSAPEYHIPNSKVGNALTIRTGARVRFGHPLLSRTQYIKKSKWCAPAAWELETFSFPGPCWQAQLHSWAALARDSC